MPSVASGWSFKPLTSVVRGQCSDDYCFCLGHLHSKPKVPLGSICPREKGCMGVGAPVHSRGVIPASPQVIYIFIA